MALGRRCAISSVFYVALTWLLDLKSSLLAQCSHESGHPATSRMFLWQPPVATLGDDIAVGECPMSHPRAGRTGVGHSAQMSRMGSAMVNKCVAGSILSPWIHRRMRLWLL